MMREPMPDGVMETHRLVLTEDLNHHGFLFGGKLLGWVDEASYVAASLDFPQCRFVTIGMDKVEFRHSVQNGTILRIRCELVRKGQTSVTYGVKIFAGADAEVIFSTRVTFVNVDEDGKKAVLPEG